eukprot:gene4703-6603_t
MAEVLQVKRKSEFALLPTRGSEFAAGFDLSSAYDCVIPARGKGIVKTDLSIAIPENTYARIAPRSGLAVKSFIDVGAGVVDYDYRGDVGVVLFNHSDVDFIISRGDRVAQLILERISMARVEEVDVLSETIRGAGGFGSTGVTNIINNNKESVETKLATPESAKRVKTHPSDRQLFEDNSNDMVSLIQYIDNIDDQLISYEKKRKLKSLVLSGDKRMTTIIVAYDGKTRARDFVESIEALLELTHSQAMPPMPPIDSSVTVV